MQGAVVLTAASFAAKLLSAVYRVPYQNLVGDEGFYAYQQVYPIYGLAMTLALSGLPQFISKFVAEKGSLKERRAGLAELYPLVWLTGVILWLGTFLGSEILARLMGNGQLAPAIRMVSFTFLLMPALSFYRGNFQGNLLMVPTAVSQVAEQILRVGVILLAAVAYGSLGLTVYQTAQIAMFGALVGGGVAVLILRHYQRKITGAQLPLLQKPRRFTGDRWLVRRFILEGGLLTIYSGLLILFQLADSFLVTNALQDGGLLPYDARITKGIFDRGQPLVQLGLVVATALGSSFLPALTRYLQEQNAFAFLRSTKMYLRFTVSISLAASIGLAMLLPYVNYTLFKDAAGSEPLTIFVFAIFLMSTIQSYQSIAQSQNHFRYPVYAAITGVVVKFIATYLLTRYWGPVGTSLSTICGLTVTLLLLIRRESPAVNFFWRERHFGNKLLLSLLVMTSTLFLYNLGVEWFLGSLQHRSQALWLALLGVVIGVVVLVVTAVKVRLFTYREWLMLPFAKKIMRKR